VNVPLQLWNRPHWELRGRPDSALFFRHLKTAFPEATTLFVEGCSLAPDVAAFFASIADPGDYLPEPQTIWPKSAQYRLPCDGTAIAALADLAERHAEPELLDHLFVYAHAEPLLEYPDAFGRNCPALVSCDADEASLRAFASVLGLELDRVPGTGAT